MKRSYGRANDQIRKLSITYDLFSNADASVLFEIGNTKVLCAITLNYGVPHFLKGTKTGWLTAEYSMLPTATTMRKNRESTTGKRYGRSVEISRLISRTLRSVVDLSKLGEQSITIDCDVLQADGGTRTASITGAYLALSLAVSRWLKMGKISQNILIDSVAAISVGIKEGTALLDIDFSEDSSIDADYNFVLTKTGKIIEIQGTSEKALISWDQFNSMRELAIKGVTDIFSYNEKVNKAKIQMPGHKTPFFSLKNRQKSAS